MLEVKQLTKYYKKNVGVKEISLKVNDGEILGFIGPNGAGKSTTIRSILHLINSTGDILIDNKIFNKDDFEQFKYIGYLPSEINLYNNMTIKEIFKYHSKLYKKDCSKKIKILSKQLKIDESKKIEELSLGNKKKVGIVLAIAHDPKLIIMDEATSGLDPLIQNTFYDILLKEKEKGCSILYSSHNLSEVKRICDRVAIIKDGSIISTESINKINDKELVYVTIHTKDKKLLDKYKDHIKNNIITFPYTKDINILITDLSKYKIDKILINDASLEELFMHYYK